MIDIHFHGTKNLDIREADSVEKILLIANDNDLMRLNGILITPYPSNIKEMKKTLINIKKAMQIQKEGVKIYGVYLEGPFLNPKKAGALPSEYFIKPDIETLFRLIEGAEDIVKIITIAPELPGALKLIEKCVEMGFIVSMGHSDATFKEAEEGFKAGARLITHLFNAMREIHHREPGIAGFGLINQEIYVELIGDGKHLSDELLKWLFNVKNPKRIILISDMVKEKENTTFLQGGSISLDRVVERLRKLDIDEDKLVLAAEKNPKRLLGISFL